MSFESVIFFRLSLPLISLEIQKHTAIIFLKAVFFSCIHLRLSFAVLARRGAVTQCENHRPVIHHPTSDAVTYRLGHGNAGYQAVLPLLL